jgi:hypothetical protein
MSNRPNTKFSKNKMVLAMLDDRWSNIMLPTILRSNMAAGYIADNILVYEYSRMDNLA